MPEDDITNVFADLKPEDFVRETSATHRHHYAPALRYLNTGANNFNGFVDAQLLYAKERTTSAQGFQPVSFLHNLAELRTFQPDDDETAPQYARRLTREAHSMGATWFWTGMIAPGRVTHPSEVTELFDADNVTSVQAGLQAGILRLSICWCAASLDTQPPLRRGGVIFLDEQDNPVEDVEGVLAPGNNFFHGVLGTHA